MRTALDAANAASPFNQLVGIEIAEAGAGRATLGLAVRPDHLNHAGVLHAGVQAALLDTAAGYAAASEAGNVVAVQIGINLLGPARAERFEARARVVRAGKRQLFAEASLHAVAGGGEELVATATVVLARVGQ